MLGCNTQLKRIGYVISLPIIAVILTVVFCYKGWWKLKCWVHYLMLVTGVAFVVWVYRKIVKGQKIEQMRSNQKEKHTLEDQLADNIKS